MMQCLGEMATWLPLPGAVPQYCARYVDPALGYVLFDSPALHTLY
jgi:amino acid transporter